MAKHYVDNRRLLAEIIRYKAARVECPQGTLPPIPSYVGEALLAIAKRISLMPNFRGYSYRDEMINDAVVNSLRYLNSFNPNKTNNPFAYFTRVIYNAFLRRIETEHMETYTRDVTYDLNYLGGSSGSSGNYRRTQEEDAMRLERMARFEQAKNRKKKKK